jgi:metallo-beta-lactamase family protein
MCEGGPVVKQLPEYLVRESVTFMATGYMSENSTGAAIVAMLKQAPEHRRGTLRFSIRDRPGTEKRVVEVDAADVRATLADMSGYYSGHADVEGLCDFSLSVLNPRGANLKPQPVRILLNHGNDSARRALVDEIKSRSGKSGLRCVASVDMAVGGRWYDLEKHMRVCKRSPTAKQPSVAQKQSGCLVTQKSRRFTDNPARKNVPIIVSTFNLKRAVEFSSC